MNPLCCIAPVSIDRDRPNPAVVKQCHLGFDTSVKNVNSAHPSSIGTDLEGSNVGANHEVEQNGIEPRDSKVFCSNGSVSGSVAGVLYKWVNYGKGWRSRWFVLQDGVLSYYKIHGPDKIMLGPARDKGMKVIGEQSLRYMSKASGSSNKIGGFTKQWKPFGEIHLKVCVALFHLSIYLSIGMSCVHA